MIGYLRGKIIKLYEDSLIIDVNGVGYKVYCGNRLLSNSTALAHDIGIKTAERSQEIVLYIETHVREDHINLYGFASEKDKEWFNLLQKVKGVGAKLAVSILGISDPESLQNAIFARDKDYFKQISGVGPKLAERIILELKDELKNNIASDDKFVSSGPANNFDKISIINDAVSALANLGYNKTSAYNIVSKIMVDLPGLELSAIVKTALKELATLKN